MPMSIDIDKWQSRRFFLTLEKPTSIGVDRKNFWIAKNIGQRRAPLEWSWTKRSTERTLECCRESRGAVGMATRKIEQPLIGDRS